MKRVAMALLAFGVLAQAAPALAARPDRRERKQERRIEQGERKGTVSPDEAARLQGEQAAIKQEVATERAANGGKLTRAERRKVRAEQNQASKDIHQAKHN